MSEKEIALVTGGSRGIGRAICTELAGRGLHVIVNYKSNEEAANQTVELIQQAGGQAEILKFDVTDAQAAKDALQDIHGRYKRIDVLVNNAGIADDGLFAMMSPESWQNVTRTTLDGFYNVTQPAVNYMRRSRRGCIVAISSVSGLIGNRGQVNYSAAKAGLIGACKALAKEVARLGIRVNVVAPGLIETDMMEEVPADEVKKMIPMSRIGKPAEVAKVVGFLCSEDASYVTGAVISVNGGLF